MKQHTMLCCYGFTYKRVRSIEVGCKANLYKIEHFTFLDLLILFQVSLFLQSSNRVFSLSPRKTSTNNRIRTFLFF